MVMRDDEQIHVGHVAGTVDVGALERPVEEGERCGGPEYGVDEHTPPFGLEQVGGVPEPHQQVAVPIQCAQVGLEGRDGRVGAQPLLFSEQEFEDAAQAAFVARHHRACFQVAELPVAVVGDCRMRSRRLPRGRRPKAGRLRIIRPAIAAASIIPVRIPIVRLIFVLDISFPTGCTVQRYRFLRNCGYTDYGLGYHNPRNLRRHPEGILECPAAFCRAKGDSGLF